MDTLHLPDEIVEEILSRLPVKSLVRFKCVSKSCRSLILSDGFIKKHLQKSIRSQRWQAIFSSNSKSPNLMRCSLRSYLDDPSVTPLHIDDPITDHLTLDTHIIGHSNGLLCIFNKPNSFFLWNPATRFSLQLSKPDGDYVVKCGFGWDGECDTYKVFAVLSKRNGNGNENENEVKRIGSIYNSKTNSWKALEHEYGSLDLRYWIGEFACGKIHWPVRKGYIETFDLESELFGRIEFPRAVINPGFLLDGGKRGRLGLVCDDYDNAVPVRTVWEMEMYGVEESWAVVASCLINRRRVNELSTHMAWTIHNGKLTCSPRVNIVNCDYRRVYVESLVQPVFDNNDA